MPQSRTPYLITIAVLLLALLFTVSHCRNETQLRKLATSNVETLLTQNEKVSRNAAGQAVTAKQSLQLQAADFTKIKDVQDAKIKALQQAVKAGGKETKAAVVFTAVTKDKAVGRVDSIKHLPPSLAVLPSDTSLQGAPVYYGYIEGPGFKGLVVARPDSISLLNYVVTQSYTVAFTKDKGKDYVQITALSTNTVASDVQSFEIPPAKKPKRGLWAIAGFIAGRLITFVL
jgi:hypothetical protein